MPTFLTAVLDQAVALTRRCTLSALGVLLCAIAVGLWLYDRGGGYGGSVAHYAGEGNARDDVGGANGVATKEVGYSAGVAGRAFSFNGTQFITVEDRSRLNPGGAITVAAWFTTDRAAGDQFFVNKFNHSNGTSDDDSYVLGVFSDGRARWQVDTRTDKGIVDNIQSTALLHDVFDGQFHFLVGSYDGKVMRIYFDGVMVASLHTSGTINRTPKTPLLLGAGLVGGTPGGFQKGKLDEVTIYSRALFDEEIYSIYQKYAPPLHSTAESKP